MTMLSFRSDPETDAALLQLARPGESRSDTVRRAIHDATTFARRERMRAEALECTTDPDDRAEARAVGSDLEGLRAW